ncbi:LytR/AlgR family response regulator transcription factor [Anaerosacchariphilus polymeriproducens]|uniref:Stage 0 sporulation protein A homolog n=1 Tax=Anaerosacchariphilus polymeriproducens TaxID=1812858 RepID=A0A371AZG6_9FIRM|nr:LytTR family DNA-binding domain-containing protein [Anaerosacchariphilus polymeriproducens]RDU24892.1 DNA-binding response regulator [Anaerosacchariphilus polymeriproducens]
MRILICDDDSLISKQLCEYIQDYFKHTNANCPEIFCFTNGESLLADQGEKDILFLDVEMPGLNGIYTGSELKKRNNNIIIFIVTSYLKYLDDAMRIQVFRYLFKPLDKKRFENNMKDALNLYNTSMIKLPIETKQGVHTILTSDIIFVEAQGRRVIIHTEKNDYESIHNMKYWLDSLPRNNFFQTHRSFIINMEHVSNFDHSLIHLAENQYDAYLTRRKYKSFKDAYLLYLESMR